MSARQKLNSIYLAIAAFAAFVAGFIGLATKSITIFVICLGLLAGLLFHDGSVRLQPKRRR